MANPLFSMLGGQNPLISQFTNFMNTMQGKDPQQILNDMISSGKINQNQLNMAQQKAKEMETVFSGIKNNFGF